MSRYEQIAKQVVSRIATGAVAQAAIRTALVAAVEAERDACVDLIRGFRNNWLAVAKREGIAGNLPQRNYLDDKAAGALDIQAAILARGTL